MLFNILCGEVTFWLGFKLIGLPIIIMCSIILCLLLFIEHKSEKADEEVIGARGGIRMMYSALFRAIENMPEGEILFSTNTSMAAMYRNYSHKQCRMQVDVTRISTEVSFSIRYQGKWVQTLKKEFKGSYSGGEILMRIILNFPDCDLSC